MHRSDRHTQTRITRLKALPLCYTRVIQAVAYSPLGRLGHAPPLGPAAEKSATQQLKTVKASNALKRILGSTNEALITLLLILIIVGFCFSVSNR